MKGWLIFGRWASGAILVISVVAFLVDAIQGDGRSYRLAMVIAEALGALAVPFLIWLLYSWCTLRLRALDGAEAAERRATLEKPVAASISTSQWPAAAKVLAPGILVAVVVAVLFRYETTPSTQGSAYKRDRWTGNTYFLYGPTERKVVTVPAKE